MDTAFYISAAVAVVSTFMVITRKAAVHALLYLIVSLLAVAMVFFVLGAPLAAALEVIIYAGAIMVLFVFVVMLLNLRHEEATRSGGRVQTVLALAGGVFLVGVLWMALWGRSAAPNTYTGGFWTGFGTVEDMGRLLFNDYLFAFEAASVLLLVAMIGSVVLARRKES